MILTAAVTWAVGVLCIFIGFLNRKGNISMLHSYHTARVSEEDRLPFGKRVGNGMIVIGVAIAVFGGLMLASQLLADVRYATAGTIVMAGGFGVGLWLSFSAMMKYNKGIF